MSLKPLLKFESKIARFLPWFIIAALVFGAFTLLLLSPTWMRLSHLLIADLLWVWIVAFVALASCDEVIASPSTESVVK